jgi:agmatinase
VATFFLRNAKLRGMISLLGIPFDANSSFLRGPALAPARIRQMRLDGSANDYSEHGLLLADALRDAGDVPLAGLATEAAFEAITESVDALLARGEKVVSLGGDHSVTWPVLRAFARHYPDLHILHLDAHADLYDTFEGDKWSHACPFARIMEGKLAASLTQIGIRTLNAHQRAQAARFDVQVLEMKDWRRGQLPPLRGPLYISLDLDVLDPAFAPGVSHHEPGGLSTRELLEILHAVEVPIVGADLVELNPLRDWQNMTAMLAFKLLKELVYKMY